MRGARPVGRRYGSSLLVVLLLAGTAAAAAAPASADAGSDDRSGQAQAVLDRVLGPGNSVVEISATVRAGSGSTTTVSYGAALPAQVTASRTWSGAGSTATVTSTDVVDGTTTTLATPAGGLVRQTVAVVVNRAALGLVPLARLRRLVAATVGLTPGRGDRLVLVATSFAKPAAVPAPARPTWTDALAGLAVPAIETAGALVALVVLVLALGGGRRAGGRALRRS